MAVIVRTAFEMASTALKAKVKFVAARLRMPD
jgi:hypothetical protein